MANLYNAHGLGISSQMTRPRNLDDVGSAFSNLERWANQIPFLEMNTVPLPAQVAITTAAFVDVTGFNISVTPQREGQLIVAFVSIRASRFAGAAQITLRPTLAVGTATPTVQPGDWYLGTAIDYKLAIVPIVSRSNRRHTIQIQAQNTAGGSTWLIRSPESSITVITI